MARLLVQLKLHLLANALHSSTRAKVSFVVSTAFAGLTAASAFAILALLRGQSTSVDVTAVIFTLFGFGWLIMPLLAFGLDGTLDPATLALYPLRTRPLAAGLLAASAAGAWPLASVLGLLGVTVGLAHGALGLLVALVAVLLQVLFCITLARFVTTGMAGLLRSRRGKDFAAFLVIPLFALYEFFTQVVPRLAAAGELTPASFAGVDAWLRWLPPGLAAHAIQDASNGHPLTALLRLALLAAVIAVLGGLWIRSLGRALVCADSSTQSSQVRATALPLARYGLRGAVAARFWIYQRREPVSLVYWCITGVIMIAASVSSLIGSQRHPAVMFLSAILGAAFVGVFHANSVGVDRAGLRPRGHGADRPRRAARLSFRPEHRARRDWGTAAGRAFLRPRGPGREPRLRVPDHAGRPGRARRRPGPEQHLHDHGPLPDGQADRQSHPRGRGRLRVIRGRGHLRQPLRRRRAGRPGDSRRGAHQHRPGSGPDTVARRLRRRLRPRAGLGRRADRSPRRRGKTAGTLPDRYPQPAIDNPDPAPTRPPSGPQPLSLTSPAQ